MNGNEAFLLDWFATANYSLMKWMHAYWWQCWAFLFLLGSMIGMSPLQFHHEQNFRQIIFVLIRKLILYSAVLLTITPLVSLYLYDATATGNQIGQSQKAFVNWFVKLTKDNWPYAAYGLVVGFIFRFMFQRYINPYISNLLRKMRNEVVDDTLSDIRVEADKHKAKDFDPQKYYVSGQVFVGLDIESKPIYIPLSTWLETNAQVVGPTRYGKGVELGNLIDQAIRRGETVFYVDPKTDKFLPAIMQQACAETGRKFYYLTLHDDGIGKWAPFAGGSERDGLARAEAAFGLQLTGDPGTDFYKTQERRAFESMFKKSRNIEGLRQHMAATEALRINAELERWSQVQSLCPKSGTGFTIEKALTENAVVYVQGSLTDSVIKTATKVFILELLQEIKRLDSVRTTHVLSVIDEVSFLVFKELAQALATLVGFRSNFVLAYQSQNDLLALEDATVNSKYIYQSINVNSQIKMVYGGADADTAEWASTLSGTIQKEVTKMEKTAVTGVGGEAWDQQRTVGATEENYITMNTILTLPPRVCVIVQPRKLASLLYTSFVTVKNPAALPAYIQQKQAQYSANMLPAAQMAAGAQQQIIDIPQSNETDSFAEDFAATSVDNVIDELSQAKHIEQQATLPDSEKSESSVAFNAADSAVGASVESVQNVVEETDDSVDTVETTSAKSAKNKQRKAAQKERKKLGAKPQDDAASHVVVQPAQNAEPIQQTPALEIDSDSFMAGFAPVAAPETQLPPEKDKKETLRSDKDMMAALLSDDNDE